jgi:hypothetical protein
MKGTAMDRADRCRAQADECHRLMLLAQSGAEATILTSLMRSWKMIANQTDRYVAIMKTEAAQRRHGQVRIHLGKTHGRGERDDRQV